MFHFAPQNVYLTSTECMLLEKEEYMIFILYLSNGLFMLWCTWRQYFWFYV